MTRPIPVTTPGSGPDMALTEPQTLEIDDKAESLKETISTVLSALAMLAMAVGVGWGIWPRVGPFSLFFGGALLSTFLMLADAGRRPKPAPAPGPPPRIIRKTIPGPTSDGNLHAKGPGASA